MNNKILRRLRIRKKIRKKINGTFLIPRLSIYKSNKTIYAQLIDDEAGKTLASACSLKLKGNINIEKSKEVGKILAKKAILKGIHNVIFDRSGYIYHGKIKALAEGAKEKGLIF
jgi:large subunit ribosomal protein L18